MLRVFKWLAAGCALILAIVSVAGGLYIYQQLPTFHQAPDGIIETLPDSWLARISKPRASYRGLHPSQTLRPQETFTFPIRPGETGPQQTLFAGPPSYPFWCGQNLVTNEAPLVDNHDGVGVPVHEPHESGEGRGRLLGYSRDCTHPTVAGYYFKSATDGRFYLLGSIDHPIEQIEVEGKSTDFVVRMETGTINRYFYAIAVLRGEGETLSQPTANRWNGKLIYQFRGGVGIGKRQGNIKPGDVLARRRDQLREGYAVVYSSANQTSNHYNIWLAEDTALRVKRQFIALYGEPEYTVGVGGSGGAIQQYLLAQNHPGLLDGIIPLYSYPDMISQTIYVLDCEPLEYYFDVQDRHNHRWRDWSERVAVEGLSSADAKVNYFNVLDTLASLARGDFDRISRNFEGGSECVQSWRGLTPLIHNPRFVHFQRYFSKEVQRLTQWTHWEDLHMFYGRDQSGFARSTWDNVGVQYGLAALVQGRLEIEEFLELNARVGGWKTAEQMQPERYWFLQGQWFPVEFSAWSHQNLNLSDSEKNPAPRTQASLEAIEAAYRSGHVFLGDIDLPILDVRHYLDRKLDMHHASASFMTRARLNKRMGRSDHQAIWISHRKFNPVNDAFTVMDEWLLNLKANPDKGVAGNRPVEAGDTCFGRRGNVIARGEGVWDGEWNGRQEGRCSKVFPSYPTSREIAGAPINGDIFKCHLQPVKTAVEKGVYGKLDMGAYVARLERIFPDGVCDYELADMGFPKELEPIRRLAVEPAPSQGVSEKDEPPVKPVTISHLETEKGPES
ncbi:hypothetical protein HBA55_16165 [Pseudomaricurvus alkylphenolicus]|jgi:hypothetical protein|uniref:DUF6351 family protein n=1 Tax=Pseudomaricurvus alkylphenolicus TaxID=1306991 RepID=UPI00141D8A41|nr:DUF6351 family protein [Pseudomaricurvus alkylphenolicus]NIB41139.1 hypothetical protein [Pseudomaricurvus alkylphenolicus]